MVLRLDTLPRSIVSLIAAFACTAILVSASAPYVPIA